MAQTCWLQANTRFALNEALNLPASETLLRRSENWICAVDIAPLVVGHLLLTPVRNVDRFDLLEAVEREALADEMLRISQIFWRGGESTLFFEHCSGANSIRGCVSQVHVHCLPVSPHVEDALQSVLSTLDFSGQLDTDYLRVWRPGLHGSVSGASRAEQARRALESVVASDCRPWRVRLMEDLEALPCRLQYSLTKLNELMHDNAR